MKDLKFIEIKRNNVEQLINVEQISYVYKTKDDIRISLTNGDSVYISLYGEKTTLYDDIKNCVDVMCNIDTNQCDISVKDNKIRDLILEG